MPTSHRFQLSFTLGNDAFAGDDRADGIAHVLRQVTHQVGAGYIGGPVLDVNGNRIGNWNYDPVGADDEGD
jgi:hypothetical protein